MSSVINLLFYGIFIKPNLELKHSELLARLLQIQRNQQSF